MSREAFIKLVVVPLVFLAILAGVIWYLTANRIKIVNNADGPLENVVLEVRTHDAGVNNIVLRGEIDAIDSERSASYFLRQNAVSVQLRFKLNGRRHEIEQATSLHPGVNWELHVEVTGKVQSRKRFFFD